MKPGDRENYSFIILVCGKENEVRELIFEEDGTTLDFSFPHNRIECNPQKIIPGRLGGWPVLQNLGHPPLIDYRHSDPKD